MGALAEPSGIRAGYGTTGAVRLVESELDVWLEATMAWRPA